MSLYTGTVRRLGNARLWRWFWAPSPLELAPGRAIWENHRGREYRVFIDESFFEFFGFARRDGNFCHAAVGIPTNSYAEVQNRLAPLIHEYRNRVSRRTGRVPTEIKSTTLRTLHLRFQARFTREIASTLAVSGGFVSGFFTPTTGFVMERVRESLIDDAEQVPERHDDLYETARQELLLQMGGPGEADLIRRLVLLPVAAIQCLLASFECPFRIQYDPRQHDEDEVVRRLIGEDMDRMLTAPEPYRQDNYLGMDADRRSDQELGLQLADVIAGQVRDYFRNHPEALEFGTTRALITGASDEPIQKFEEMEGQLFKIAAVQEMPRPMRRVLVRRNMANLISYCYPVLASGILTCVTNNGQERDLELSTGLITDLLD